MGASLTNIILIAENLKLWKCWKVSVPNFLKFWILKFQNWKVEIGEFENWHLKSLKMKLWKLKIWKWEFEHWKLKIASFEIENPQHPSIYRLPPLLFSSLVWSSYRGLALLWSGHRTASMHFRNPIFIVEPHKPPTATWSAALSCLSKRPRAGMQPAWMQTHALTYTND